MGTDPSALSRSMMVSRFSSVVRPEPPQGHQVIVWQAALDHEPSVIGDLESFLSDDEIKRANKLRLERDRSRFVAARGKLRQIIGSYLEIKPEKVRFDYGPNGKPRLDKQYGELRFNISHSGEMALFAFADRQEIGVDVEYCDRSVDVAKLARYVFDESDIADFCSLSAKDQISAFYRSWTRKEALAKAMGINISALLNKDTIRERPFGKISERIYDYDMVISHLDIGNEYVAAIASESKLVITWSQPQIIC